MQLDADVTLGAAEPMETCEAPARARAAAKGKGKAVEGADDMDTEERPQDDGKLTTLDIFAGCGGLSEGLQQSGGPSRLHQGLCPGPVISFMSVWLITVCQRSQKARFLFIATFLAENHTPSYLVEVLSRSTRPAAARGKQSAALRAATALNMPYCIRGSTLRPACGHAKSIRFAPSLRSVSFIRRTLT